MRILVVNVNTTAEMTKSIGDSARRVAAPGTEIVELTPFVGADSVEGNLESFLAAVAVMDRVLAYEEPFDAVIQAGFGEHGKEGLMEILDVPVVDITDAGAQMAYMLGFRYSVVTTLDRTVPLIEERLRASGLFDKCASLRSSGMSVLDLENRPDDAVTAIVDEARRAVEEDKAEVIVLGCGGMANLDAKIKAVVDVPIVDGVASAVKLAESLVSLGYKTSKIRTYAPPRPKVMKFWPLHKHIAGLE